MLRLCRAAHLGVLVSVAPPLADERLLPGRVVLQAVQGRGSRFAEVLGTVRHNLLPCLHLRLQLHARRSWSLAAAQRGLPCQVRNKLGTFAPHRPLPCPLLLTRMMRTPLPTSHLCMGASSLPLYMQKGFMWAAWMAEVTAALTMYSYSVPADQSL